MPLLQYLSKLPIFSLRNIKCINGWTIFYETATVKLQSMAQALALELPTTPAK